MKKKKPKTIELNGIKYEWVGGFGCMVASHEKDMWEGDCRKIGDTHWFFIYMKHDAFKKNRCCWIPVYPGYRNNKEFIEEFRKSLFGGHCMKALALCQ